MRQRTQWSLEDFEVGPKLGEGRFGKIYLCREKATRYAVVLKLISKAAVLQNDLTHQIRREIELQLYCKHRHVLRLFAYFWDDERIFLALDYAEGGNLLQRLQSAPAGRLPEPTAAAITAQLCSAVRYLHSRGILHRDIKPENILFKKGSVKLADFTWAVYLPHAQESGGPDFHAVSPKRCVATRRRFTLCGTIDYLPPELVQRRPYDEAADMWSVGATCFEMLVGRPPFETSTVRETEERISAGIYQLPSALRDHVSDAALDFIRRLLVVNADCRMTAQEAVAHPFIARYVDEDRASARRQRAAVPDGLDSNASNSRRATEGQSAVEGKGRSVSPQLSDTRASLHASSTQHQQHQHYSSAFLSVSASTVVGHGAGGAGRSVGGSPGATFLMVSNVLHPNATNSSATAPSDVTASTQEGHGDSPSHVARSSGATNPSGGSAQPAGAAGHDSTVERALHFDDADAAATSRPPTTSTADDEVRQDRVEGQRELKGAPPADSAEGDGSLMPSMNVTAIAALDDSHDDMLHEGVWPH